VSNLTSSLTQLNFLSSQQSIKTAVLRRYLFQNGIPVKLAMRVQRNAAHAIREQQRLMPESEVELLALVSQPLQIEIHFEMHGRDLKIHPFFAFYIEECPQVMRKVCHHSVLQPSRLGTGDVIFNVGEIPANPVMYFVTRGELTYDSIYGTSSSVTEGQWISEATLWTHWMHRGVLTAANDCRVTRLDAQSFQDIASQFSHQQFDPKLYAEGYTAHLNNSLQVTDLCLEHDGELEILSNQEQAKPAKRSYWRKTASSIGTAVQPKSSIISRTSGGGKGSLLSLPKDNSAASLR